MPTTTDAPGDNLVGTFGDRAAAEDACARLEDASRGSNGPRLGVAGAKGGYTVTLSDLNPERLEAARAILQRAGAITITVGPPEADAPRPVQPGFTDAPPGIVPEAADFRAERYEGPGGRFAKQIDELPETDAPDKRSARDPDAGPPTADPIDN